MPRSSPAAGLRAAVHFRSLGCPKNQLDTEIMLGALSLSEFAIAERLEDADVAIVNTCAFIESAREESIQAILDVADLRESGRLRALLVTGCMPQRYGDELAKELPEVDAFIGTSQYPNVPEILGEVLAGRSRGVYVEARRTHLYDHRSPRLLIGPGHSAFVKTSEGCDRICSFCAIPGIRGKFQSRTLESLVLECQTLAAAGVKEVNLVAQDQTSWGKDLPGRPKLARLLRSARRDRGPRVDPPALRLSHGRQRRAGRGARDGPPRAALRRRAAPARERSPAARDETRRHGRAAAPAGREAARGDPGSHASHHRDRGLPGRDRGGFRDALRLRARDALRPARLLPLLGRGGHGGLRPPEQGAARGRARSRTSACSQLQRAILAEKLAALVGRELAVLVDAIGPHAAQARLASQAPEIDGGVLLRGACRTGELRRARITGVRGGVDLEAEVIA